MSTKINDELAAEMAHFAESVCLHGNHADFCVECDDIRKCHQVTDFPTWENNPPARFDLKAVGSALNIATGKFETLYEGGALPGKVRDEDDHSDIDGKTACTRCFTVPASNGSCGC